jgi:predicted ATP-dependent endonuclease of OLD family
MRLTKLKIKGFKSVKGGEILATDDRITILIGANDHGKSNLLAAILCLNDDQRLSPDDLNWDLTAPDSLEITWHFKADDATLAKLKELGPHHPPSYSEILKGSPSPEPEATFAISSENEIIFSRDLAVNGVRVAAAPVPVLISNEKDVLALRPRVELFDPPSGSLVDQVTLPQLDTPAFEFMQGIFRLAGLWETRDLVFVQNDTTSRQLKEASDALTTILNDQWNQGKDLKWIFEHTGTNGDTIVIKIEDPAIKGRYTRPSLRSSGFRSYFLLSMIIYARTQKTPNDSYIYLFDEPGTYLHPSAQLDLQRSFETIADQAQLVYTTHSIFLISKNYPARNRVIAKTINGTKIDQKPFTKNWKSVRQSLGILLSNNFLIAEKTLLVEGPSDALYFLDALKRMKEAGKIDADLNDMSIVDAGDAQNYVAMAKIMLLEGRSIVALADGDAAGKKLKNQLEHVCEAEIKARKLHIHLLPENRSSEDIFANIDALRSAVKKSFNRLVDDKTRTPKEGIDIEESVKEIITVEGTSLGRTIEKATRSWFTPADKISKLLIAIFYEDEADNSKATPPDVALTELETIKKLLGLRSEKSKQTGVFEEVDTIL